MAAFKTLDGDNVIICDPCESEGRYFHAEGFCTDCNDYLCAECLKVHRRPVLWRYHQILTRQEIPKVKSPEEIKDDCVEPCAQHRSNILEYYCSTHDELACSLCMFRNHRLCQGLSYIPDIAETVIENDELKNLKDSFADFLNDVSAHEKSAEETQAEAEESRKVAVRKLMDLKQDICNFLDQVIEDVAVINQRDSSNVKASNNCFQRITKKIITQVSVLEKKEKENKRSQLFVATKRFKTDLKEMQDEVRKSKEGCNVQHFEVVIEDNGILEMKKCLEKILKLNVQKVLPSKERQVQFLEENQTEVQYADSKKRLVLESLSEHTDGPSLPHSKEDIRLDLAVPVSEQLNASCIKIDAETEIDKEIIGQWSRTKGTYIQQYNRKFLLKQQFSFHALQKPAGILDIPDIVFDKPLYNKGEAMTESEVNNAIFNLNGQKTKKKIPDKGSAVLPKQAGLPMKKIKSILHAFIVKETADNLGIIGWINCYVDQSVRKGNSFIKTLMNNVCQQSLEKDDEVECVFDIGKIRARRDLLKKYLAHNPDLELQALYALQLFVGKRKCPPGNIREILDALYEADIISENGFFKWETSEEMKECKEIIVKEVVPFFTWLLIKDKQ